MKTITAIALLALAAFAIHRFEIKADPSGAMVTSQLRQTDSLAHTGLIADPSGVAMFKVSHP